MIKPETLKKAKIIYFNKSFVTTCYDVDQVTLENYCLFFIGKVLSKRCNFESGICYGMDGDLYRKYCLEEKKSYLLD